MSKKKILGLDLGSNSIGWALLEEQEGDATRIIAAGCRIFTKAVEEKTPTPKNAKRRQARLARRVIQRRARRKQRMLNYLISLGLLPRELKEHNQPEIILNKLGDPYQLRAKALDEKLTTYELGRVLLHLVQRRGFLSNRKTLLGDMAGDPDVLAVLEELEETDDNVTKEEGEFKRDITQLRRKISESGCRTLGEYLFRIHAPCSKRNRKRDGGHLRTDRKMYQEELLLIWDEQKKHHPVLTNEVLEQIQEIIFKQRPLKLDANRIGRCSLEPAKKRTRIARLEYQRFRYLQDINNLQYFDNHLETWRRLTQEEREKLKALFENEKEISIEKIRKQLGLGRSTEINLGTVKKKFKGNITACTMREALPDWDELPEHKQLDLLEDILTIKKKSVLKRRLTDHWKFDIHKAIDLCLLEFEPGHGNLSLRAIRKLLPYLEQGQIYSDARISAGYAYEKKSREAAEKLSAPPDTANPIVNKALHELRRVVNALIAEYGKPDAIRIEMARDLEMNTKRHKKYKEQQKANTKANEEATQVYREIAEQNPHLQLSRYPSREDKIRYRIWKDQDELCVYSGRPIPRAILFSSEIEVDHILPFSQSLDDSYMNKVVCYAVENRDKGQRTPIDAFGENHEQWEQITQRISRWHKSLQAKRNRFYMTAEAVQERDFINSQLNDTRYISRLAHEYLQQLGSDISVTKGIMTGWLRHMWGLNSLIGCDRNQKDRTDHRHHTIDAIVTACINRSFYQRLVRIAGELERSRPELKMRDLRIDPPWPEFRNDVEKSLNKLIVSYTPRRKLTGALHEETGVGFIEGIGAVYRIDLDTNFETSQAEKILDNTVRDIVKKHLANYDNSSKKAFADGTTVFHKDGKTPIKRVRIRQSKTTLKKLKKSKLGIKNRDGKPFRWMAYGNLHHVEIIRHKRTGKVTGQFVTMLEASHRARGIHMPKQPIIKTDHGPDYEFLMVLHINDLVEVTIGNDKRYYRVQKLDSGGNRIMFRLHTAATLDNESEAMHLSINRDNFTNYSIKKITCNAIGKILE